MLPDDQLAASTFKVAVSAIAGGPFFLRKGQVVTKEALGSWLDSLLRLGAIEPIESAQEEAARRVG